MWRFYFCPLAWGCISYAPAMIRGWENIGLQHEPPVMLPPVAVVTVDFQWHQQIAEWLFERNDVIKELAAERDEAPSLSLELCRLKSRSSCLYCIVRKPCHCCFLLATVFFFIPAHSLCPACARFKERRDCSAWLNQSINLNALPFRSPFH